MFQALCCCFQSDETSEVIYSIEQADGTFQQISASALQELQSQGENILYLQSVDNTTTQESAAVTTAGQIPTETIGQVVDSEGRRIDSSGLQVIVTAIQNSEEGNEEEEEINVMPAVSPEKQQEEVSATAQQGDSQFAYQIRIGPDRLVTTNQSTGGEGVVNLSQLSTPIIQQGVREDGQTVVMYANDIAADNLVSHEGTNPQNEILDGGSAVVKQAMGDTGETIVINKTQDEIEADATVVNETLTLDFEQLAEAGGAGEEGGAVDITMGQQFVQEVEAENDM